MEHVTDLREKWDRVYQRGGSAQALPVLTSHDYLLPESGEALDLACGLGGNAEYLARRGLCVLAWDISSVAMSALARRTADLPLVPQQRDVVEAPPPAGFFDVVCVGHFLDRDLCPSIAAALKPGGLLFYQTFIRDKVDDIGPGTDRFRLERNELLTLFPDLTVRFYREEGSVGDIRRGVRNVAQLVAQRCD